jgi:hypothetical protein
MNSYKRMLPGHYLRLGDVSFLPQTNSQDKTNIYKIIQYIENIEKRANHLERKKRNLLFLACEEFLDTKGSIDILVVDEYETNKTLTKVFPEKDYIEVKPFFGKKRTLKVREDIEEHSPYFPIIKETPILFIKYISSEKKHKQITTTIFKEIPQNSEKDQSEIRKYHQELYNWAKKVYTL